MKKRLVSAILASVLVFSSLTGCSAFDKKGGSSSSSVEKTDEELVQESSDEVMRYCKNAEYNSIVKVVDSSAKKDFANLNPEKNTKEFYKAIGYNIENKLDDTVKSKVLDFWTSIQKDMIKSYKVKKVKVNGKTAQVRYSVKYAFTQAELVKSVQDETVTNEFKAECEQYGKDHAAEVTKIYQEQGEEGLYQKIFNDILPSYIDKLTAKYNEDKSSYEGKEYLFVLELKYKNGKWVVTSLKSNDH
ncbi:hypothetical protein [Lachnobacterium bovis]|uniref:DUF5105 domain-containing protein n=1 Tax=Lachnobacterium bovis DSM 14045 TaxID=1122142 RepID=A0A1H3I930_9FIRM|nr:hypothetical protein [Lachnobacterium bovis]SDY24131.1 hypothetical protein SAMN02910414_01096 [Lachnobacterium bovis DSM 14045]